MKKENNVVYLYNYNQISARDLGPDVECIEIPKIFYAELKVAHFEYNGNLILMSPEDADDYEYIDTHRPENSSDWKDWMTEWDRLYHKTMKYRVKVWKDLIPVVINMVHGTISGWWKWGFSGGLASVTYIGREKPNESIV